MGTLNHRLGVYRALLKLYPKPYQHTYADQMLLTLDDMLTAAPSRTSRTAVLLRAAFDLPLSIVTQQTKYLGGCMAHDMPRYIKITALAAAICLVPFMAALAANSLSQLTGHGALYHTWLWCRPLLAAWVLYLPLAAVVLALGGTAYLALQRRHDWNSLSRIVLLSWPALLVGSAGLGIIAMVFGHDSVHCITGNPVHEIQHWQQTWRCIQQR